MLDSPSTEVTRIRNCTSTELAMTFRSKTIDKWTAYEVQDILNEHHSGMASVVNRTTKEKVSVNVINTTVPPSAPSTGGHGSLKAQATDSATLDCLISMLEKVIEARGLLCWVRPGSLAHGFPGLEVCMKCLVWSVMMPHTLHSPTVATISSASSAIHRAIQGVLVLTARRQPLISRWKTDGSTLWGGQCGS